MYKETKWDFCEAIVVTTKPPPSVLRDRR